MSTVVQVPVVTTYKHIHLVRILW